MFFTCWENKKVTFSIKIGQKSSVKALHLEVKQWNISGGWNKAASTWLLSLNLLSFHLLGVLCFPCFIFPSWHLKPVLWDFVHAQRLKWKMFAFSAATLTIFHLLPQVTLTTIVFAHRMMHHAFFNILPINVSALWFFCFRPALSCNFESGLCGWYQDNSDNFDWTMLDGMDHTIGIGELHTHSS